MQSTVGDDRTVEQQERCLERRVVTLWRLAALLFWMPVGAGLGAASGWLGLRAEIWDGSAILMLAVAFGLVSGPLLGLILPPIMYRRWRYSLAQRELRLRHGVLVHTDTWVPYGRIQYIELRQGIFERRLRLASLVIHTAGSIGAQVVLPGLALDDGEELRRGLLSLIEHDRA